jgi:hypothetical protein
MNRRASTCIAAVVTALAVSPALATDNHIVLNYNWNGITQSSEEGQPDSPNGFRSIADRAIWYDGATANALGTSPIVGNSAITYTIVTTPGVLDIIHLGNTIVYTPTTTNPNPPAGSPTRWWDGSGAPGLNASHGVQPAWLSTLNHTSQTTTISPALLIDSLSSIGVLYQISNGGGAFDMVLGFTDSSTVTVTLSANDWFGPNNPPGAGAGVASQTTLGGVNNTYNSRSTTDSANATASVLNITEAVVTPTSISGAGLGNIAGKSLNSITFQNPNQPLRGYAIFSSTVVTGLGPPVNDDCSSPTPVLAGSNPTNNLRATGSTTSGCGNNDTTDVWYSYQATTTGLVEARTCGALFDTTVAVYATCGGAALACNDNACGLASRAQWNAVSGNTYLIRVAGNNATTGQYDLFIDTAAVAHTDQPIALNYNWNGMVHTGEDGLPDAPNGYRSISDRGLHATGAVGSINGGTPAGTDFIPYSVASAANQLDIVHLGNTGPDSPRDWDAVANGDARGTIPAWLTNTDQSGPQRTNLAPLAIGMGASTEVGVLFNISNGGGFFNCTLEFSDSTTATVQLAAPDWYQNQTPPPPGTGVLVQRQLGTFPATQNQDLANTGAPSLNVVESVFSTGSLIAGGLGDTTGKRLTGITFGNISTTTVAGAVYAVTFRDAPANHTQTNPVGVGGASPSSVETTRSVLLTVSVSPGLDPTSSGVAVQADLSSIGGNATQTFYDDGTHGDATPSNLVFSFAYTIPSNQSTGSYSLPFTVSDAQSRTASGTINLSVQPWAWNETLDGGGDAGDMPATSQAISGSGPLAGIRGTIAGNEADMYAIYICDHTVFSATTVNSSTSLDTQMFLFDGTGHGVTADDDSAGTSQSTLTSQFVTTNGLYYLAISEYDKDPRDISGNELWIDTPYDVERQPDALGAANPIASWDANGAGGGGYLILLTGVCRGAPPPPCGSADFNCDGDVGTDADIEAFFACLAGTCPPPPCPNNADFNGDGDVGTDADIEAFFRVLAGGTC